MGSAVTVQVEDGIATLLLQREHGNAINADLVEELSAAVERAAADDRVRAAVLAAAGKLFCPGLDLQELVLFDRPAMERFVERFGACSLALYTFPKPLVAAIHGHAVAGGCVLALTADWRVLREGAVVGFNETRVGVPFPFGVARILREALPPSRLAEVALLGRNYEGSAAIESGLVHEVAAAGEFESRWRERAAELADKDGRAYALTKGYLRSEAVERIRAHDAGHRGEFLDAWFSPATRARVASIAAELRRGR